MTDNNDTFLTRWAYRTLGFSMWAMAVTTAVAIVVIVVKFTLLVLASSTR